MIVKRKLVLFMYLCLVPVLFVSCSDVFHDISAVIEEISKKSEKQEPKRIFIGGNFIYNSVGSPTNREAFAVLTGYGQYDDSFFQDEFSENGIGGFTESDKGVRSIKILNEYVYVAGDFEFYDFSLDDSSQDSAYQKIVRYGLDGALTLLYSPASFMVVTETVNALQPLPDGSLFAGGDFTNGTDIFGLIKIEPDGSIDTSKVPLLANNTNVFTMFSDGPDYDTLFYGGNFSDFTAIAGFSAGVVDDIIFFFPGLSGPPNPSIKIKDIEVSPHGVFFAGIHGGSGVLARYDYSGTIFIRDDIFMAKMAIFTGKDINAVAVSDSGFIYVGGNFAGIPDSNGVPHNNLIRLYPNGDLDPTFDLSPNGVVHAIEIQANGAILVGGNFSNVGIDNFTIIESTMGYFRITDEGTFDYDFDRFGLPSMVGNTVYAFAIEEWND